MCKLEGRFGWLSLHCQRCRNNLQLLPLVTYSLPYLLGILILNCIDISLTPDTQALSDISKPLLKSVHGIVYAQRSGTSGSFRMAWLWYQEFFKVCPGGIGTTPKEWHKGVTIPGRLACLYSINPPSNQSSSSSVGPYCSFRDCSELGKMQACPSADNKFHRSCSQHCLNVGISNSREHKISSEGCKAPSVGHFQHYISLMRILGKLTANTKNDKDQSHTSLHVSSSTVVTEAICHQSCAIGTSTCAVGRSSG